MRTITRLEDALDLSVATARLRKEQVVWKARGRAGETGLTTQLVCIRAGIPVAIISPMTGDRGLLLRLFQAAAVSFGPDYLACVADARVAPVQIAPVLVRPTEGWQDCVFIHVVNRAGDRVGQTLPYRVDGREVEWLPVTDDQGEAVSGTHEVVLGGLANGFAQAMTLRVLDASDVQAGIPDEDVRDRLDCLALNFFRRTFPRQCLVAVVADPGTPRDWMIRQLAPGTMIISLQSLQGE